MIEIKELTQEEWSNVINSFPKDRCDIYATPNYYNTWEGIESGSKVCLSGAINGIAFVYSFYLRPIDGYVLGGQYFDVVTAYGYGGLFADGDLTSNDLGQIENAIHYWMRNHNVVAELVREHPLFAVPFPTSERIQVRNNVFASTIDKETAWKNFQTNARNHIRRAQKNGLIIEYDENMETMDQFSQLYSRKAMFDDWDDFYHFPSKYFLSLKNELNDSGAIVRVLLGQQLIAAAIVLYWPGILHNHLAATEVSCKNLNSNDLLYWGMVEYAINKGCKTFSLGGGLSLDPKDPLFSFKKKFGNIYKPVFIGRRVYFPQVYGALVTQWQQRYPQNSHKSKLLLCYREVS